MRTRDLDLAQGTLTDGLKAIVPMFDPVYEAIVAKNLEEKQWHADETRWYVFATMEGKVGYRWYLRVFISESAVVCVLDPSRSAKVPKEHFGEDAEAPDKMGAYRYCGRDFSSEEIETIRAIVARDPGNSRTAISRLVCEALQWYKPDGGLKDMLALPGFGAAAWKTAPRERFIGWNDRQRQNKLNLIVNNSRFLVLPWVSSKNLASRILGGIAKRLPADWHSKYNLQPVLLETFVESGKYKGTCYKAANWISVGKTKGRGKLGDHKASIPKKDVLLYPLCRNFKQILLSK